MSEFFKALGLSEVVKRRKRYQRGRGIKMIIKEYGKYIVYCDGCDETLIEGVSWKEAIEAVKQNDWKAEKVDGEWEHYCPTCL